MRPVRHLAPAVALATVLAGCGGAAADPAATLRDALEGFTAPEQGTVTFSIEGDLATLVQDEALGGDASDEEALAAAELLADVELRTTTEGDRVAVALDLGGSTVLDVRTVSEDELYVRVAFEDALDALAAVAPDDELDAGELEEMAAAFGGGDGPLGPLLAGEWVRIEGAADLAGDEFGLRLPETDELPSAGDVDLEAAIASLDAVDVTEFGVDQRCGDASRYDAAVPGEVLEELQASLGAVEGFDPLDELGADLDETLDTVDLSVWLDGDDVVCLGLDLGATIARAEELDAAAIAAASGTAHVVVRFSDDVTGLAPPEGAVDLDLEALFEELIGAFLGGGFGGEFGDLGDDLLQGPDTYGDDAELDALWDACAGGDDEACGELWLTSPFGSAYEAYGASCGERSDTDDCGGGGVIDAGPVDDVDTYGDDAGLDALWDACVGEDGQACDDLYWQSPVGSAYEAFGETCGGREDATAVGTCNEVYGSG